MKDRSLLLIIVALGVMSVVIDFANAILSRLSDGILMGMIGYAIYLIQKNHSATVAQKNAEITALTTQVSDLRREVTIHKSFGR